MTKDKPAQSDDLKRAAGANVDADVKADADADVKTDADVDVDVKADANADVKTDADVDVKANVDADVKADADVDVKVDVDADVDAALHDRLAKVETGHHEIIKQIEELKSAPKPGGRDIWDKLAAVTPLISGVLISGIGLYFAYTNNQAQLKLQEVQTIEKLIPHFAGSEAEKKAAVMAMSTLTNPKLAVKFAQMFPSQGTALALKSIASSAGKDIKQEAEGALVKTFHAMGEQYLAAGNSVQAERSYQEALDIAKELYGSNDLELSDSLEKLAKLYESQGKFELSARLYQRSIEIREKNSETSSPAFIANLRSLANVYRQLGKVAEANALEQRSLIATHKQIEVDTAGAGADKGSSAQPASAGDNDGASEPSATGTAVTSPDENDSGDQGDSRDKGDSPPLDEDTAE